MTEAIVIKHYQYGEKDKILVLYSKDLGLIKAVVKGIRSAKSQFMGRLELGIASKLLLYKGKNLYTIQQCDTLESFTKLRKAYNKLINAMYFLELMVNYGAEEDPASFDLYTLLYSSLKLLEKMEDTNIVKLYFEIHLMDLVGYSISFNSCTACNQSLEQMKLVGFSPRAGGAVCYNCSKNIFDILEITPDELLLLHELKNCKYQEQDISLNKFNIGINSMNRCIELFILERSEKRLKSLELINNS